MFSLVALTAQACAHRPGRHGEGTAGDGDRSATLLFFSDAHVDLWRLYPIDSRIKTGQVTGAQLRAFWEREIDHVFATDPNRLFGGWLPRVSGMSVVFVASSPVGQRTRHVLVGGVPLDDQGSYRVAACEREGDPADTLCRIPHANDARVLDRDIHDVIRAYLGRTPDAAPPGHAGSSPRTCPRGCFRSTTGGDSRCGLRDPGSLSADRPPRDNRSRTKRPLRQVIGLPCVACPCRLRRPRSRSRAGRGCSCGPNEWRLRQKAAPRRREAGVTRPERPAGQRPCCSALAVPGTVASP